MKRFLLALAPILFLCACTNAQRSPGVAQKQTQPPSQATLPPAQSYAAKDVQITQDIRRSILADKDMSVNAQNIKITSQNGHVTLIGAVDDQAEHATVRHIVESIPGVVAVNDRLDILNSNIAVQKGAEVH